MPTAKRSTRPQHKRHGNHQKRTGHFLKVYHPFLPLLFIVVGLSSIFWVFNQNKPAAPSATANPTVQSQSNVLAFATSISNDGLLNSTNQRRAAAGANGLSIDSKLTQAAQTKANDMASRNYWAHNTPDGTPPWTFITNAGYSYSRAGENLACGFNESSEVITGWYNSPSHRDNLLNPAYKHVGFGVVNATNYNCGDIAAANQTIIVAMYGTPYEDAPAPVQPRTAPAAAQPVAGSNNTASPDGKDDAKKHTVIITVLDSHGEPSVGIKVTLHSDPKIGYTNDKGEVSFTNVDSGQHTAIAEIQGAKSEMNIDLTSAPSEFKVNMTKPALSSNQVSTDGTLTGAPAQPKTISRLDLITSHTTVVICLLTMLVIAGVVYLIVKHSLAAHRFFIKEEQYILKHKYIDVAVALLLLALYFLTRSVGAVL